MKPPIISRQIRRQIRTHRQTERGVTMALVAAAMVAIMAMAALSIDAVTLYLANAEAQRSADSAALAAARVISLSGITGTASTGTQGPYWQQICGGSTSLATQTAQAVATQNTVGGVAATVTTTYSVGTGSPNADCSTLSSGFAINPLVQVKVQRASLPTFFARIWGKTGSSVSATAVAEAFNSSNSGSVVANGIVPVQPRCVKPWIVPNFDPLNPSSACTNATPCGTLASTTDGSITHPGISLGGSGGSGVIGEQFVLIPDCRMAGTCALRDVPGPLVNRGAPRGGSAPGPPNLEYLPGQVSQSSTAVPSDGTDACSDVTSNYAQAIAGCDQSTLYQCGVASENTVDLSENPRQGDTANGVQCLIHQGTLGLGAASGQDTLDDTNYPFQIKAGDNNPLKISGNVITSSNSVVTVPIYDNTNNVIKPNGTSPVTIVGFLQVFINGVDTNGNVKVTVLNVTGCSNSATNPVFGSSPVPVRLITPP
jgi:putative Flp pilus-assembly TadE/G-like protein/putative Tad-like protein involved in Flp pilus assembly